MLDPGVNIGSGVTADLADLCLDVLVSFIDLECLQLGDWLLVLI
jgi:hypothetical protein